MSTMTIVYDSFVSANRWTNAKCCNHLDLPWTADFEPGAHEVQQMSSLCAECPVLIACARYALTEASGGFYAGVWLPWRPANKGANEPKVRLASRRHARSQLRAKALITA